MGFRGARAKLRPFDIIIIVKAWICLFVCLFFKKQSLLKKAEMEKKRKTNFSFFSLYLSCSFLYLIL